VKKKQSVKGKACDYQRDRFNTAWILLKEEKPYHPAKHRQNSELIHAALAFTYLLPKPILLAVIASHLSYLKEIIVSGLTSLSSYRLN